MAGATSTDVMDDARPKSKKKMIVIVTTLLLVVLTAGGVGSYFYLNKDQEPTPESQAKKKAEPIKPPVFLSLEPFVVNLASEKEDDSLFLQITINLQLGNNDDVTVIKQYMPQIRHRMVMLLSSKKGSSLMTVAGKEELNKQALELVNEPFSSNHTDKRVKAVYFTSFIIQ